MNSMPIFADELSDPLAAAISALPDVSADHRALEAAISALPDEVTDNVTGSPDLQLNPVEDNVNSSISRESSNSLLTESNDSPMDMPQSQLISRAITPRFHRSFEDTNIFAKTSVRIGRQTFSLTFDDIRNLINSYSVYYNLDLTPKYSKEIGKELSSPLINVRAEAGLKMGESKFSVSRQKEFFFLKEEQFESKNKQLDFYENRIMLVDPRPVIRSPIPDVSTSYYSIFTVSVLGIAGLAAVYQTFIIGSSFLKHFLTLTRKQSKIKSAFLRKTLRNTSIDAIPSVVHKIDRFFIRQKFYAFMAKFYPYLLGLTFIPILALLANKNQMFLRIACLIKNQFLQIIPLGVHTSNKIAISAAYITIVVVVGIPVGNLIKLLGEKASNVSDIKRDEYLLNKLEIKLEELM